MTAKKSSAPKKLLASAVVLAACALGGWLYMRGAGNAEKDKHDDLPVPVTIAAAKRQDVPVTISSVGTVVPFQTVNIKSRLDSQIMAIRFHDGDEVKKGDVLFQLDDRALKAQLAQAQADLARDQAQLENLKWQLDRNKQLIGQKAISEQAFKSSKAAADAQAASVQADEAAISNLNVQIGYTTITAPIDGRTGTINVTLGNNVKANDTGALVTINQIRPILVQASLPQKTFTELRAAMQAGPVPVTARVKPDGEDVSGTLKYIDNMVDQGTGTYATRATFDNPDEKLWPGMLVPIVIRTGTDEHALVIPEVAVQSTAGRDFVFVIKNGKAERRPVTVTRIQGDIALVGGGLKAGEQVATDGMLLLTDGAAVSVAPDAAQKRAP
ncbi:MAG: efflux RND transporter periplasmic adaptor subunit [Alphaproteobacteria bacterium]|nr:efflux RND transporter periplasmic adaptor subunit [Alphaproteobacteria bacterium]